MEVKHALWWPGDERAVLPTVARKESADVLVFGAPLATELDFKPKVPDLEIDPDVASLAADADALLAAAWPEMYAQAQSLLTRVYPMRAISGERWPAGGSYGTRSRDLEYIGQVYATTDTTLGFVEGIVASLGNWKLYAAGITLTDLTPALFNDGAAAVCRVPLREERLAPAGTSFHATYAIAHAAAFYQGVLRVEPTVIARERLAVCQARLQKGWAALSAVLSPKDTAEWMTHFGDVVAQLTEEAR